MRPITAVKNLNEVVVVPSFIGYALRILRLFSLLIIALVFSSSAIASEPSPQRQQELQNMLKHDCGSCHGLTLKGGLGPSLLPDALKHKTDDFLVQTIREGRKGTAMPPWKPFMTEQETLWLVQKLLKH